MFTPGDYVLYTAKDLPEGDFYRLEAEAYVYAFCDEGYLIRVTKVIFCGGFWQMQVGNEFKAYENELARLPAKS